MLNNHLNVFEIESYTVNVAGEKGESKQVYFDNNNENLEYDILEFILKETGSNHIERMESELKILSIKIEKLSTFLSNETKEAKFTDPTQRLFLSQQLNHMFGYRETLRDRIKYDSEK